MLSARAFAVGRHVVFGAGQIPTRYGPRQALARTRVGPCRPAESRWSYPELLAGGRSAGGELDAASAATGGALVEVDGEAPAGIQLNAEVYIWNPHVDGYGHAAIKLCDGTYISWWPAGGANSKAEQYWSGRPGGQHSYADDIGPDGENQAPDATYDLGCNCLDEDRIKKWYDTNFIKNPAPKWAVLKNSCSDVAHQALNEGSSFTNPCYLSISHSNLFWKPKDLGAYAACQARWCKSKSGGALDATGRYVWENLKEVIGGGEINFLQSIWWKGEIIAH